jgi:hypothetical protein
MIGSGSGSPQPLRFQFIKEIKRSGILSRHWSCSCTSRRSFASQARIWLRSNRLRPFSGVPGTGPASFISIVVGVLPLNCPTTLASKPDRAIWNARAAALNPHPSRRSLSTQAASRGRPPLRARGAPPQPDVVAPFSGRREVYTDRGRHARSDLPLQVAAVGFARSWHAPDPENEQCPVYSPRYVQFLLGIFCHISSHSINKCQRYVTCL